MTLPSTSSFVEWYCEGQEASFVRSRKSAGDVLNMIELARPAGDYSRPAMPDLVLYQPLIGGVRVSGDTGAGSFSVVGERHSFYLAVPDCPNTIMVDASHVTRSLSFGRPNSRVISVQASSIACGLK